MAEQLAFELPVRAATGREDFFVAPANALAVAEIDRWQEWPARKLALIGPEGSGKSHLARVWSSAAGARVYAARALVGIPPAPGNLAVEDVQDIAGDTQAETALFHWHNLVLAEGGHLLLTGNGPPALWPFTLPDLASRIRGTPIARLDPPDDQLLQAVLLKLFTDRQLVPPPSLLPWLVSRMDRSFAAAGEFVHALDAVALGTGRPIGPKLASEVLERLRDQNK
ncbi:DnaA/Hda family protein [Tropicimonas marinistellae]|uniref:DnaA/Hda family protein n=1 Tax=Tropicimonas marinistellae TaxID=1739787 RepID=UPI00082D3A94|nr:DnaA/Hda family protein [Tropicimonas marinistellae]